MDKCRDAADDLERVTFFSSLGFNFSQSRRGKQIEGMRRIVVSIVQCGFPRHSRSDRVLQAL